MSKVQMIGEPVKTIYATRNYDAFRRLEDNRAVLKNRAEKLVASFSEKELINPIIVNEKYEIIDGQGRYEALKRLGRPIKYTMEVGANIDDCRRMNKYNSNWSLYDWVDSWSKTEDKDIAINYLNLMSAVDRYKISVSRALRLANIDTHGSNKDGVYSQPIESGKLRFPEEKISVVGNVVRKGNEILKALLYEQRTTDAFWTAVKVMVETKGYDHDRMLAKCRAQRVNYAQMSKLEDQLKEFSRIYNYRTRGDNTLFFEDYMRNRGYHVRTYEEQTGDPFNRKGESVSSLKTTRKGDK